MPWRAIIYQMSNTTLVSIPLISIDNLILYIRWHTHQMTYTTDDTHIRWHTHQMPYTSDDILIRWHTHQMTYTSDDIHIRWHTHQMTYTSDDTHIRWHTHQMTYQQQISSSFSKSTHEKWSSQGIENFGGRRLGRPWPENRPQHHRRKMRKGDMDLQIKWMIPFCT